MRDQEKQVNAADRPSRRPRGQRASAVQSALPVPLKRDELRKLELALSEAADEREFLSIYLDKKIGHPDDSALRLAERAGYRTSSFISECVRGRRPLPAASVEPLGRALLLSEILRRLFVGLAQLARPEELRVASMLSEISLNVRRLRERIRDDGQSRDAGSTSGILTLDHFAVFAALEVAQPFSLPEVASRTKLSEARAKACLEDFVHLGVTYTDASGFRLKEEHLSVMGPQFSAAFKTCFLETIELVTARAREMESYPNDIFFQTTFSIDRKHLRAFQNRIQDLVLAEVEGGAQVSGNQIAHLSFAVIER